MTIQFSREEVEQILKVEALAENSVCTNKKKLSFQGVEFSSQSIRGGELFIALRGETTDGHRFITDALERGAAMVLSEESDHIAIDPERIIYVKNTRKAFFEIAHTWRKRTKVPIVAITGSVGKTTTKEILARILLEVGVGTYSQKSYNNHTGVPYTLCQLGYHHEWAVLEVGMNHSGEISELVKIIEPECAVITRITEAHIENLGSLENIARAKLEIIDGLVMHGILVLNGSDPILMKIFKEEEFQTKIEAKKIRVVQFGYSDTVVEKRNVIDKKGTQRKSKEKKGDKRDEVESHYDKGRFHAEISSVVSKLLEGISFRITFHTLSDNVSSNAVPQPTVDIQEGESEKFDINIIGRHNALNAAVAVFTARIFCEYIKAKALPLKSIQTGLSHFTSPLMRMNVIHLKAGHPEVSQQQESAYGHQEAGQKSGRVIIDDSYNANPGSMEAFLNVANDFVSTGSKVGFIVGDMLELGEYTEASHRKVAEQIHEVAPDFVIAVGEFSKVIYETLSGFYREGDPESGGESVIALSHCDAPEEAAAIAQELEWDFLFVKASRKIALDKAVAILSEKTL
jgi:UDP-N-acetylmuramyl pentapeptide synthase